MIDAVIHIGKDGPWYPTKIHVLPSVGDIIELTSHTDMKDKLEGFHVLKVKDSWDSHIFLCFSAPSPRL